MPKKSQRVAPHSETAASPIKLATIYDVARHARVSAATVSRTFSRPEKVRPETRERVLTAAAALGFRAHPLARALPSGRTSTLALAMPAITNPHFFEIISGAEKRAAEAGFSLILANTAQSARQELQLLERLDRTVDGAVLASSRLSDDELLAVSQKFPIALCDRQVSGIPSVSSDQISGAVQAIRHCHSYGHRSVVVLEGPRNSWAGQQRRSGIISTAGQIGMKVRFMGPFSLTVSGGASAADAALSSNMTAVLAHNDLLALGILERLSERGVKVPDDLSVMGFGNIFGSELCTPKLTTIAAPTNDLGRMSVDLLLERIDDPSYVTETILSVEIRPRASTGPAKSSVRN